jgi:ubiquinone/menaquinone biosynthesis C-methylase UbiE
MRLTSRGMSVTQGHVRVPLSGKRIQTLYDSMSSIYDLLTRYERGSLKKALEIANPRENLLILEAGFGTGRTLVELAKKVGDTGEVYALDVSRTMTNRTHRILHRCNLSHRVNLVIGDARHTPFCDTVFDLVFSSYMLDLIDSDAIPRVLSEFKRLLKSTGSLVLVGLSKGSKWYDNMKLYEWAYRRSSLLFGACRPVLLVPYLQELGFKNVNRKYMRAGHLMPTEIAWANKDE